MRLREVFRFEVAYQVRRVSTWVMLGLFVALAFMMLEDVMMQEARGSGNVHANAPFAVAFSILAISMMGVAATAALFGDAATRDVQSRMRPLFFTTPLSKVDYLGGRFLGAFVVNALLLAAAPLTLWLAPTVLGLDPALFAPFRPESYLQPYLVLGLSNLFIASAVIFTIAALSGRAMAGYGGALLLFLSSLVGYEALAKQLSLRKPMALLDPFGFTAFEEATAYWTPAERNAQLLGLEGILLWNRLIWVAAAAGVLAFLYLRFRFAHEGERGRKRREERPGAPGPGRERTAPLVVPHTRPAFGFGVRVRQALAVARLSFGEIVRNRYFPVVLVASLVFLFVNGWDAGFVMDTPTWPVTYVLARGTLGDLTLLIYILVGLYAGELVWMEREAGTSEIADAAPMPSWVPLAGKFGALVLALVVLQAVLMAGGVLVQALRGYYAFEPGVWIRILFGFQLADYLLVAALAMLVHVLVDQKYLGHLVFILYFAARAVRLGAARFGFEHNLLVYGGDPGWVHSDLSGFEPFLGPYLWFNLYWAAWALLFAVAANLFWVRGREGGVAYRVRQARLRLTRQTLGAAAGAALLILTTGGFVFYNTNVLNEYRTRDERIARLAEYERLYKRFEGVEHPRLAGSRLHVEIYPSARAATLRGSYRLQNRSAAAIDSIHLIIDPGVEVRAVGFDRPAERVLADEVHGYRIYALGAPLQPGDSLRLSFDLAFAPRGFPNSGINAAVVKNGTYFDHGLLPAFGYRPEQELKSGALRREHGLAPRERTASVRDEAARRRPPQNAEWFHSEVVVGTEDGQTAVAPGALRGTWTRNGRRYFHYVTDAPIKNVFAFLSADYAVREDRWRDVEIEVLHHPTHTFNVDRMVRSTKASLEYLTEHFGPYPYRQLRIAELPRHHGSFARALPGMVAYSEGFGFVARAEHGIDYPFVVTAHEVAHQWWGGQFAPAEVQGRRVLYETLAHYSALMVMEKTYGPATVRRLLDLMLHRYLVGRQNREGAEVPLLLSEEQNYIHYDKGALAMYALRDYIGEERVNTALRRFLEEHRFGGPPYPTTLDLYEELQAVTPDSLQYLLTDLFEDITLWELRTREARAEPDGRGGYRVTLEVEAHKLKADSIGRDRRVPMDDLVEVGVFAAAEDDDAQGEPLYLRKHRLRSGEQTITVTVPKEPARAGIDPYHRLIDRGTGDNVREVVPGG